jgi:SAM-dependent methyltransferase
MKVLATDSSPAMLAEAERKIAAAGLRGAVSTRLMDLNDPYLPADTAPFDGVLSNFGGLNCVQHLAPIWNLLRRSVREGGVFVAVPMGRWCAWEIGWNLLQLNPGVAFRRLRREGIPSSVGGSSIRVFYPSLREWRLSAQPAFQLLRVSGLGVFLPPLYLAGPATAMRLIPILDRLESALAGWPPFRGLGDHLILEIVRSGAMASGRVPAASRVASRRGLARTVEPA